MGNKLALGGNLSSRSSQSAGRQIVMGELVRINQLRTDETEDAYSMLIGPIGDRRSRFIWLDYDARRTAR